MVGIGNEATTANLVPIGKAKTSSGSCSDAPVIVSVKSQISTVVATQVGDTSVVVAANGDSTATLAAGATTILVG